MASVRNLYIRRGDGGVLRQRLQAIAEERPRFGYRRLYVMLRREGFNVNHKRVYRMYRAAGLKLRRRLRKRVAHPRRHLVMAPVRLNDRWSMDFMSDQLADGRRFRTLNIVDDFSRECLAIEPATSLPGSVVVRVLERLAATRGYPVRVIIDNGPEFTGRALDTWAYAHGVSLEFIAPGRPMQRHRREFQRQVSGRVLESALVRESAGCSAGDRGVEKRLQ